MQAVSKANYHVAIVDDEESVRRALHRLLRSAGLIVDTYPTGAAFLESLGDRQPDCVLLDLHMPGLSGFDVQARLNAMTAHPPVVIMTGHDSVEAHDRAIAAGAAAFFRKPFRDEVLLEAIRAAIEKLLP